MKIRPARLNDAEPIGQLWVKLAKYHAALDPDLPRPASNGAQLYARRIANRIDDSYTHTLVAEHDGVVVGYALGVLIDFVPEMFEAERGGFLADIYVEEPYRRQGVGRALVDALMSWFREHGARYFELYVAERNADGRAFWEAVGGRSLMLRMRAPIPPDFINESETGQ